jgi:hypothetical protein
MAKRRKTDNTMAKRRKTDNIKWQKEDRQYTMAKRRNQMEPNLAESIYKIFSFRPIPPTNMATKGNSCF